MLLLLVALLMSGLFDTFMIQVLGYQEVDRRIRIAIALLITGLVGATALAALGRPASESWILRVRPSWESPMYLLVALAPLWLVVGLINQWPLTYIIGDVFMIGIMPATYFVLTRHAVSDPKVIFRWIYALMLLSALLSTALVLWHNVLQGNRHKMSLDGAILPTFYIMLKSAPAWAEILLLPLFILAGIATSKRSTWAGLILAVGLALVMRPGLRRPLRLAGVAAVCGAVALWASSNRPQLVEHTTDLLQRRWVETVADLQGGDGSDLLPDAGGRAGEIFGVFDTISARRIPVDWALGLGLGAIVESRGGRTRHHIHSTPAAFLARTGLIGLAIWAIFVAAVFRDLICHARRPASEWLQVQFLFWLGAWTSATLFSVKSLAFWGSVVGGIQLAYMAHLCYHNSSLFCRSRTP